MSFYDQRPWISRVRNPTTDAGVPRRRGSALAFFHDAVAIAPGGPALHYYGRTFSFEEIDLLSDRLAAGFAIRGIGAGDRVSICLQNVPQFPVAMLAAWKLGAVVVPTNPMWKDRELTHLFEDCRPTALVISPEICTQEVVSAARAAGVICLVTTNDHDLDHPSPDSPLVAGVETFLEVLAPPGVQIASVKADAHAAAFLTYTSGTTGPPKGAVNTHANVAFNAETFRRWVGLDEHDICLAVAPFFHVTGLIANLTVGFAARMPLLLAGRFDAGTCVDLIEHYRPTYTIGAITVFRSILEELNRRHVVPSSLTKVYSGGSAMMPTTLLEFEESTGAYIRNVYGMTETTSPSHMVPSGLRAPIDPATGAVSVGIPVDDTTARVIDDDDLEVAPGVLGELVIEGPQVFPGYWENPDATAAAMRGSGVRTGDIGYMDADGWFYVVDRKKDMINASGFKVWPREVEDVLTGHPDVLEAAVVGAPDTYRGETVVGFVVLTEGSTASETDLIAFARERMAAYKYPRVVTVVNELPKTSSGKVLRRGLRDLAATTLIVASGQDKHPADG